MPARLRVVLDTNVIVSGFISPSGPPGRILKVLKQDKFTLLTSQFINEEVLEVMNRPRLAGRYGLGAQMFDITYILWELAEVVTNLPTVKVSKDPDDNMFLSAAEGGLAHYLVTGDIKDLLHIGQHKGTRIVTPIEFLSLLEN